MSLLPTSLMAAGYDIWLYELDFDAENVSWTLGPGKAVTARDGYDNQPSFVADSLSLLFASDRLKAQNDIYRYRLSSGKISRLTHTPGESEYSPQPGQAGIRYIVEQGVPHQSVWYQEPDKPRARAINSLIPAGYYAHHGRLGTLIWARYAYSLYFEPPGETADERHFVVADAGRSIHAIPNDEAFSYLHKQRDGDRVIKRFAPQQKTHTALIALLPGASEDYGWSDNNWIFNVSGDRLVHWQYPGVARADTYAASTAKAASAKGWQTLARLTPPSDKHPSASRVALSPDNRHIAIVWLRDSPD